MIINKELFQKSGVPLPSANWTWDDFLKAARQITRGDGSMKTWGIGSFVGPASAPYYAPIKAWQEGGNMVDKTRTKFTLHQTPAVEQMQWVADLVTRHRVHAYGDEFRGRTPRGVELRALRHVRPDQRLHQLQPGPVRLGHRAPAEGQDPGHPHRLGRPQHDRGEQEQGRTWEVLKMLGSKPSYEHWAKLGLTIPTFKEVAESPLVLNPNSPPKSAKIATDAFAYARPEPIGGTRTAWGPNQQGNGQLFAGKLEAKAALQAIVPVAGVPALQDARRPRRPRRPPPPAALAGAVVPGAGPRPRPPLRPHPPPARESPGPVLALAIGTV